MQKSILLHLFNGGVTSVGTDHYISAARPDSHAVTKVSIETFEGNTVIDVKETPEEIHEQLNFLSECRH